MHPYALVDILKASPSVTSRARLMMFRQCTLFSSTLPCALSVRGRSRSPRTGGIWTPRGRFCLPCFCRCPFPVPLSPLSAAADDDAAADDAGAADEEAAADDAASRFIFARLAAFSSAENSGIVVGVPG